MCRNQRYYDAKHWWSFWEMIPFEIIKCVIQKEATVEQCVHSENRYFGFDNAWWSELPLPTSVRRENGEETMWETFHSSSRGVSKGEMNGGAMNPVISRLLMDFRHLADLNSWEMRKRLLSLLWLGEDTVSPFRELSHSSEWRESKRNEETFHELFHYRYLSLELTLEWADPISSNYLFCLSIKWGDRSW